MIGPEEKCKTVIDYQLYEQKERLSGLQAVGKNFGLLQKKIKKMEEQMSQQVMKLIPSRFDQIELQLGEATSKLTVIDTKVTEDLETATTSMKEFQSKVTELMAS